MGFGREAKRVRDASLPHAYRLHALGSCIQISQPIGFHATWSYLEAQIGRSWRDPEFLAPALEVVQDVRRRHSRLDATYGEWRREQKRRGHRFPARGEVTAGTPRRWHGDERMGAIHALTSLRTRRSDPLLSSHRHGSLVIGVIDRALDGRPTHQADDLMELQAALVWSRRQAYVIGWQADPTEYRLASMLHHLLSQLHVLTFGEPRLGAVWDFTDG